MPTNTTNYSFQKPTVSGDSGAWGGYINDTIQDLDDLLGGTNSKVITGIDINSGTIDNAPIGAGTPNTGAFTSVAVDNITIDGQQITSTDTDGNIQLFPNGTGYVELYGNTNSGRIRFNCESNSHGVTLAGPAHSAAATYSIALPDTLGTSQASAVVSTDASGDVSLAAELTAVSYNETYVAVTSSSNATSVSCEAGNSFSHTLSENTTFTFDNPPTSGTSFTFSLKVVQDASASGFTLTWPGAVDWAAATAPTLTATASAVDYFVFTTNDGGTTWYGFTAAQAMA